MLLIPLNTLHLPIGILIFHLSIIGSEDFIVTSAGLYIEISRIYLANTSLFFLADSLIF